MNKQIIQTYSYKTRKTMRSLMFLGVLFTVAVAMNSCGDDVVEPQDLLSEEVVADLQFLKEEEKLARDVYLYAYAKYGRSIFDNISNSEQSHMDAVSTLLEQYNIEDLSLAEEGRFSNQTLQTIYDDLIAQVDISEIEALVVGATIEDLDIHDIDEMMTRTAESDISNVYEKLTCGSRNHLRGFTGQLSDEGETYAPQYISQDDYETILNGSHENCGG